MKKILRRVFLAIFAVIVIGVGVGAYQLFHDSDKPDVSDVYLTDSSGSTYLAVVDDDGTTYAVVTDQQGNRYAASFDGLQVGDKIGQINDQVALDEVPTNYTGVHIDDNAGTNDYKGDVSTTIAAPADDDNTTTTKKPSKDDDNTTTTKKPTPDKPAKLEPYRIDKYQQVFKGGTYLMEITTNDVDLGDYPITMAIKNGNMYIDTTIEGMSCKMLYLKSKDTMYLIFNDWKKYCKLPADMMGEDMDMGAMLEDMSDSDIGEITVSEVEINGKKLILESYNSTIDGTTVNYYFDDETLVRRDNISTSGAVDSTYFNRLTTNVPDSYFEIPDGYGYINLSWLDMMM